jgi:AmmeMemoRadiSam system protein A
MKTVHSKLAFKAIQEYIQYKSTNITENDYIPIELSSKKACFVTLKTFDNRLRGCIGTIAPRYSNLFTEIIKNAISSAFFDHRFPPLNQNELYEIDITVEVIEEVEPIEDINLLDPKIYGAIISDHYGNKGVLLPDIDGIDTVEDQIKIIKRKAGITQDNNSGLLFYRFKSMKFN